MNKLIVTLIFLLIIVAAFKSADNKIFILPKGWPKPYYDFNKNPLSNNKIQLGRALFYDPILSRDNTISCSSCHSPYNAFAHVDHTFSHGIDNRIGIRNAPALMNLAWQTSFMWDGAINHLDMQALAPISNKDEMDETIANVVYKLQHSKIYPSLYKLAFGDCIITGEHTLKAISQFLLTVVSSNSKYDSVMRKKSEFTEQQLNGYNLFKKNCSSCHTEPLFTNLKFENNGLSVDTTLYDYGRINITHLKSDSLKFKVPTLRNIEYSYPYMHDGRFKRLSDVINHYTSGVQDHVNLSSQLQTPIELSSNEKVDLISFLLTLTDKHFIFNPDYSYPKNIFYPKPND